MNFDGSDLTLLTPGDGFHSIDLAKNGKYLIDNYSRADQEPIAELRDTKGRKIMEWNVPICICCTRWDGGSRNE